MAESFPIALGSSEDFQCVREFLIRAGYTMEAVAERLGLDDLVEFINLLAYDRERRDANLRIADSLTALVKVFLCGAFMDSAELEARFGENAFGAMTRLGLITRQDDRWYAPILLYPLRGVFVVSDRLILPDGKPADTGRDFVFLALQPNTEHYLMMLPPSPCRRFLDLGTGSGVAAAIAARNTAEMAWGTDIADRSVHFAQFNRRLNGLENISIVKGNLYEPVAGLTFDRIASHPPYVWTLALERSFIFADGGDDGERLIRGIVSGLPGHLEPGGRFYGLSMAADRKDKPLEDRIRGWLGDRAGDFDVALAVRETTAPMEFIRGNVAQTGGGPEHVARWKEAIARHEIESLVYGYIVLQRASAPRPVFTVRRNMGTASGSAELEWLLAIETAAVERDLRSLLLESKPKPAPSLEMDVLHRVGEHGLVPASHTLRVEHPFHAELECRPWLAYLMTRCDGRRSGADHAAHLREKGILSTGSDDQFFQAMTALVAGGFVWVDGLQPPSPTPVHSYS